MGENCPQFCETKGTDSISQGSKIAKKHVNAESQVAPVLEGQKIHNFIFNKKNGKKIDANCHLY
jgi:hypothetical protein